MSTNVTNYTTAKEALIKLEAYSYRLIFDIETETSDLTVYRAMKLVTEYIARMRNIEEMLES